MWFSFDISTYNYLYSYVIIWDLRVISSYMFFCGCQMILFGISSYTYCEWRQRKGNLLESNSSQKKKTWFRFWIQKPKKINLLWTLTLRNLVRLLVEMKEVIRISSIKEKQTASANLQSFIPPFCFSVLTTSSVFDKPEKLWWR